MQFDKTLYSGGDGSSIEQAVIIRNAGSMAVRAEYVWMVKMHPTWELLMQTLIRKNGKACDKLDYVTPQGEKKSVYFDITEHWNARCSERKGR